MGTIPSGHMPFCLGSSPRKAATTGREISNAAQPKVAYVARQPNVAISRCATNGIAIAPKPNPNAMSPRANPLCRVRLSRDSIVRLQKTEYALVSSLQRDPLLAERIRHLRTVPGVGPITALTWALEMGEVSRFPSMREAISYCGLCGDEKSSADKVTRTPLSKQRNKHIQRVLVEAGKLAPRQDHDLALVYETAKQKGNSNRATLAVARKMVAYLLAVDRGQRDFVPAEAHRSAAA